MVAASAVLGAPGTARAASAVVLPGSAAPEATPKASVGAVPASQSLTVQVWLKPNEAGAAKFAAAVSTPGSPSFHHYLSPDAYTARFGATAAQAKAVESWLSSKGLSKVHADSGRDYVSATGPVSKMQSAFNVTMKRYRVTGANGKATTIQANNRNVSVPSSVAPDVLAVTGLDSTQPATLHTATSPATRPATPKSSTAATATCSQYWAQHVSSVSPSFRGFSKGALPVCGYSAGQLRSAYGATAANSGTGQTVALIEVGTPTAMFQTLSDYAKGNNLPAPKSSQFSELVLGSGNACGNLFDVEEQLDSEAVYAMAPGATQLMVDGDSCDTRLQGVQPLFNAELAVLTGNGHNPLASIESNSWGLTGGETLPPTYAKTADEINLRATAEGVGMYFSSGDNPGVSVPASDPYSLSVGGTTLGIGASGNRLFETGWSNDDAYKSKGAWQDLGIGRDAAGGGTSLLYSQPFYQKGVVPPSMSRTQAGGHVVTDRVVPDISADADANSGILEGVIEPGKNGKPGPYQTFVDGGTSLACPLVAGLVADAQQGRHSPFGFINPLIYSLAGTPAFHDPLPVTGSTPQQDRAVLAPATNNYPAYVSVIDSQLRAYTDQVTAKGYDTMTGVGTPNGAAFIAGLRRAIP
ncbi:MAG: S8/S53 family peptidase [Nocardiopsaceae bacterium]|nr:S8/S53 family peptidase [Nocardiopsaceae bacterium]